MDKVYLGTNTKMYKTIAQTVAYLQALEKLTAGLPEAVELFVLPSFTALDRANRCQSTGRIRLGAQNMGWAGEGQYTGEISPGMLKEVGAQIVMIGHSERRHLLGETDEMENRRVRCALENGLTPLLCVGETGEEKALGLSEEVLRTQVKRGLQGVTPEQAGSLWIAYEPVWAIGVNGVPASPDYAQEMHGVLRRVLEELYGGSAAARIPLLYGGSVNLENGPVLIHRENIDGLFVGRCAWQADRFARLIQGVLEALPGGPA